MASYKCMLTLNPVLTDVEMRCAWSQELSLIAKESKQGIEKRQKMTVHLSFGTGMIFVTSYL